MGTLGGFNCPWCRHYNANAERRCAKCERWLPPRAVAGVIQQVGGIDLWATKTLGAINIIVFTLQMAANGVKDIPIFSGMKASVILRFGGLTNVGVHGLEWSEPWRLLACSYIHMGILHIVMNMMGLADLGRVGEKLVGGPRLVITYVLTGIVGFAIGGWWMADQPYFTAGASAAVFGLIGMILGDMMVKRDPRWKQMLWRVVLYSFIFYFALRTNQAAHMGGLVAGVGMGALFALESRPWRIAWLVNTVAVLCLLASVASLVIPQFSPLWRVVRRAEQQAELARDLGE